MPKLKRISIANDFSRFPGGRFYSDGPYSGQRCREKLLAPALRDSEHVEVLLDGTLGYGSSFLEEAFGGLTRVDGFSVNELERKLKLISSDPSLASEISQYIATEH